MKLILSMALVAALPALLPRTAAGAEGATAQVEASADAFCDYLRDLNRAERAQLVAPDVFARGGLVQGGTAETGDEALARGTTVRTTLGLRYRLNDPWRATLLTRSRSAHCARHRAETTLAAALDRGPEVGLRPGLRARLDVLDARWPQAEALLEQARRARAASQITDRRLVALRVQVDELRASRVQTEAELERLDPSPVAPPPRPLSALQSEGGRAAREQVDAEMDARLARWWDVEISGGYDQLWGIEQSLPIFATVQLELDLGRLVEGSARSRASAAYARYRESDGEGVGARIDDLRRRLEARRREQSARLEDVRLLLADLDDRLDGLREQQSALARDYATDLWFRQTELQAERASLEASLSAVTPYLRAAFASP